MSEEEVTGYKISEQVNGIGEKTYLLYEMRVVHKLFRDIRKKSTVNSYETIQDAVREKHKLEDRLIMKRKKKQITERWITEKEEIAGSI